MVAAKQKVNVVHSHDDHEQLEPAKLGDSPEVLGYGSALILVKASGRPRCVLGAASCVDREGLGD